MTYQENEDRKNAAEPEQPAPPEETGPEQPEQNHDEKEAAASEAKEAPDETEMLRKKYNELNDRYLRTLAEYDNFRKRTQREKDAVYPAAVAATVEKFLPVVDSFERAMACECTDAEFKKGVDMIFDSLQKSLEALGVSEVGAVGDAFDANLHNAVMHVEDEKLGKNVVSAVLQKGYRIGERVIRYAMVTVAN